MAIQVDSQSRFNRSTPIVRNGIVTFGKWRRPDFLKRENVNREDIIRYKVTGIRAGRPDLLANDIYGRPFLEWVIVMFNSPKNPLDWPKVSDIIEIPAANIVLPNL